MNKAPRGGMASAVNGHWYDGGEFMPDHGKYCGQGRNRATFARLAEVQADAIACGKTLVYHEQAGNFRLLAPGGNVLMAAANLETLARALAVLLK